MKSQPCYSVDPGLIQGLPIESFEEDIQDGDLGLKASLENLSLDDIQVVSRTVFRNGDILEIQLEIPGRGRVRSVAKLV